MKPIASAYRDPTAVSKPSAKRGLNRAKNSNQPRAHLGDVRLRKQLTGGDPEDNDTSAEIGAVQSRDDELTVTNDDR